MTEPSDNMTAAQGPCSTVEGPEQDDVRDARAATRGSPYLTAKQAAFHLGLSDRSINNMRYRGTGPRFVRIGRSIRYHIRDLEAFVRASDAKGDAHE